MLSSTVILVSLRQIFCGNLPMTSNQEKLVRNFFAGLKVRLYASASLTFFHFLPTTAIADR